MSCEVIDAFSAYGIELEYMLADAQTLDVRPIADLVLPEAQTLAAASSDETAKLDWSNELALHVIELKNICPGDLSSLAAAFQTQIDQLDVYLSNLGACLLPTGMHPWMNPEQETQLWPHDQDAIYATYNRLFNCKRHAWGNVQSMHVNLPFANDQQFEKLLAAVRLVLPLLPAVAASSPLADGEPNGHMDYRMHVYRGQSPGLPSIVGDIVPEVVHSRSEVETCVLEPMYTEIAPADPEHRLRYEWLNARGAIPRFDRHAIEIRVMDMQECPQADVALAALAIDLVQFFYRGEISDLSAQQAIETTALSRLLSACAKDADQALIDDADYLAVLAFPGVRCSAQELWYHLSETLLSADAAHLHLWQTPLQMILQHGPLARRILRALRGNTSKPALHAVYTQLSESLRHGRPFIP